MNIPRCEHPKPQFQRESWLNLNGTWDFEIDNGRSGQPRKLFAPDASFAQKITVPFCPESELSGIGNKDFMYGVWYKRTFAVPTEQKGKKVFLHIGAADYKTFVYVNGSLAGTHKGGYVSFRVDVTEFVSDGENVLTIYCEDDTRNPMIPRGKQSEEYFSHGCDYTRTTGIWQTVWLEFVPVTYIDKVKFFPDAKNGFVNIVADLVGSGTFTATAFYEGKQVGEASCSSDGGQAQLHLTVDEIHLWEPGQGRLYGLVLTYGADTVNSYFGLRNVRMDGFKFLLNEKSVFQRLILDQGFYPDGIYTAPSDAALLKDIQLSMACGFNGARLHQKVFEERFLYHCDKEGYLVWGEYGNWGLDHTEPEAIYSFLPEWLEEIDRDFNHPALIGWCPFNETWDMHGCKQYDGILELTYLATKAADSTRPCIDTSGNYHVITDIFDVHDYEQDPTKLAESYKDLVTKDEFKNHCNHRQTYKKGQPVFVSEYGGIRWSLVDKGDNAWGYGNAPQSEQEYMDRYKALTDIFLDNEKIMGFCYTQLTDVEQEQNGVYTYNREEKFPAKFFYDVNTRKAAIED